MDYGKKKPKQLSSERQGTVHSEECYIDFGDHGIDSKTSFRRQENVAGVLTS